jgi:hypothetical protein
MMKPAGLFKKTHTHYDHNGFAACGHPYSEGRLTIHPNSVDCGNCMKHLEVEGLYTLNTYKKDQPYSLNEDDYGNLNRKVNLHVMMARGFQVKFVEGAETVGDVEMIAIP